MSQLTYALLNDDIDTALRLIAEASSTSHSRSFSLTYGCSILEAAENARSLAEHELEDAQIKLGDDSKFKLWDKYRPDKFGRTPMQIAAERGHLGVVNALLAAGVKVDLKYPREYPLLEFRTNLNLSPLQLALKNGHDEVAQRLIAAGADLNLYTSVTLEEFGVPHEKNAWPEGACCLRGGTGSSEENYNASLAYLAIAKCSLSTIQLLVAGGVKLRHGFFLGYDLSVEDYYDISIGSVLMRAVLFRDDTEVELIQYLLEKGVNANKFIRRKWTDSDGQIIKIVCVTALSLALSMGKENIARVLIKHGATPWIKLDRDGDTLSMLKDEYWFEVDPQIEQRAQQLAAEEGILFLKPEGYPLPEQLARIHAEQQRVLAQTEEQAIAPQPIIAPRRSILSNLFIGTCLVFSRPIPNFAQTVTERLRHLQPDPDRNTEIGRKLLLLKLLDPNFDENDLPQNLQDYVCPISRGLMRNPVMVASGHAYEKKYISEWLKQSNIDPKTGTKLVHTALVPAFLIKRQIEDLLGDYITIARRERSNQLPIAQEAPHAEPTTDIPIARLALS